MEALELLKDGCIHVAGTHLRDDSSGESNLPEIDRLFPKKLERGDVETRRGNFRKISGRNQLFGRVLGVKYSGLLAQVLLKTSFLQPTPAMASRRFVPARTLLRKYFDGFCIDSPTRALAAKCITASGFGGGG